MYQLESYFSNVQKQLIQRKRKYLYIKDTKRREKKYEVVINGLKYEFFERKSVHSMFSRNDTCIDTKKALKFTPKGFSDKDSETEITVLRRGDVKKISLAHCFAYAGYADDVVYVSKISTQEIISRITTEKFFGKLQRWKRGELAIAMGPQAREVFTSLEVLPNNSYFRRIPPVTDEKKGISIEADFIRVSS